MRQDFWPILELEGLEDDGFTGNFEITIGQDKKLIHSKKKAGKGKATSTKERERLVELIKAYLEEHGMLTDAV